MAPKEGVSASGEFDDAAAHDYVSLAVSIVYRLPKLNMISGVLWGAEILAARDRGWDCAFHRALPRWMVAPCQRGCLGVMRRRKSRFSWFLHRNGRHLRWTPDWRQPSALTHYPTWWGSAGLRRQRFDSREGM